MIGNIPGDTGEKEGQPNLEQSIALLQNFMIHKGLMSQEELNELMTGNPSVVGTKELGKKNDEPEEYHSCAYDAKEKGPTEGKSRR